MLPGFVLMLGLSILYVEAGLDQRFEELFYGLKAAVGALVAMAIVRLGRKFINDVPLAIIAVASLGLTLGVSLSFVLVLLASGLAYWLWTAAGTGSEEARSFSIVPLTTAIVVLGAVSAALTAEIFLEGLKAGLLTSVAPTRSSLSSRRAPWTKRAGSRTQSSSMGSPSAASSPRR